MTERRKRRLSVNVAENVANALEAQAGRRGLSLGTWCAVLLGEAVMPKYDDDVKEDRDDE